jgi:hypothetical protein
MIFRMNDVARNRRGRFWRMFAIMFVAALLSDVVTFRLHKVWGRSFWVDALVLFLFIFAAVAMERLWALRKSKGDPSELGDGPRG